MDPVALLAFNGGLQVFVSSLLGTFMRVPLQPWGRRVAAGVKRVRYGLAACPEG